MVLGVYDGGMHEWMSDCLNESNEMYEWKK